MSRMSKAHIWVGFTQRSQEEFDRYFDQSGAFLFDETGRERAASAIELSWFSKDLNREYGYEEGFMITYHSGSAPLAIDLLLEKMEDISSPDSVKEACINKGITKANAFFLYTDSDLRIEDKEKKYNDLTYIGLFDTDY